MTTNLPICGERNQEEQMKYIVSFVLLAVTATTHLLVTPASADHRRNGDDWRKRHHQYENGDGHRKHRWQQEHRRSETKWSHRRNHSRNQDTNDVVIGTIIGLGAGLVLREIGETSYDEYDDVEHQRRAVRRSHSSNGGEQWQGVFRKYGEIDPTEGDNGKVAQWYTVVPHPDRNAGNIKFFEECRQVRRDGITGSECTGEVFGLRLENE